MIVCSVWLWRKFWRKQVYWCLIYGIFGLSKNFKTTRFLLRRTIFTRQTLTSPYYTDVSLSSWKVKKLSLGDFFYRLKVFFSPKLRQVSIDNFHQKAPVKWVVNQIKGSKINKYKDQVSSDLLRESINSVIRATEGIIANLFN